MSATYERKKALIIGIDSYRQNPLKYCVNDVEDLNAILKSMEFDVSIGLNCHQTEFYGKIDKFVQELQSTDLALFYFAGHGKQNDDQNYLLPAEYDYNYRGSEHQYLVDHAINVKYITKAIDNKNCCVTIYIFDCCRNLIRTREIDMQQGLSPMHAPPETLIVFSCAPGKAALDETANNRNGIFTGTLLKYITQPHNDIEEVLKNVARDVKKQTNGFQLPFRTTSLTDSICLMSENRQGQSSGVYSQKQLECRGRACAKCGYCRDWYHDGSPYNSVYCKDYQKRDNALCCGTRYVDHDGAGHFYDSSDRRANIDPLCYCLDNY